MIRAYHFVGPTLRDGSPVPANGVWLEHAGVHMGRVNTVRRLKYAQHIGCDSVDGSGFSKFSDAMLPRYTRVAANGSLFREGVA